MFVPKIFKGLVEEMSLVQSVINSKMLGIDLRRGRISCIPFFTYFIATTSAQQLHPKLLHSDTFFSNSVIKVAQDPVRVVLRVMSLQLVEIELLQPARVVPVEEARETDLVA